MSRKIMLARIALLLFSIAASLLFVELFARVYLAGPLALIPIYGNSFQAIFLSPIVHKIEGAVLPWELKPNLDSYYKLTKFRTNSHGLRADREFSLQKPESVTRVAVLGDSFTMPSGLSIEDAYHSVLERELNAFSGKQFELLNFGVGGYSLQNYLTVLSEKTLAYQPDHILIGLCLINDIPSVRRPKPPSNLRRRPPVMRRKNPFYSYWTTDFINLVLPSSRKAQRPKAVPDLQEFDRLLGEFKRIRDKSQLKMTFVLLRMGPALDAESYQIAVRHLTKLGLAYVDTGQEFKSGAVSKYHTTRLDQHPNAVANQRFARAIMKNISWNKVVDPH